MKHEVLKPYKKEFDYTYTLGAFATIEALEVYPGQVRAVYVHSGMEDAGRLEELCVAGGIPLIREDRCLSRIVRKENCFAVGVLEKFRAPFVKDKPHMVLVRPSDMGNLGTVIRTAAAFGFGGVAVIAPGADLWHPRTVRASQGALFRVPCGTFDSFCGYRAAFQDRALYPLMVDAEQVLDGSFRHPGGPFSLIVGNEATGLEEPFRQVGTPVRIPQSTDVDSLNMAVAAGIGAWYFAVFCGEPPVSFRLDSAGKV